MNAAPMDGRPHTGFGALDQQAVMNQLMKAPLILYRMGLGPLLASRVAVLSTRGRRTGLWRYTPVGYVRDGETCYVFSARGEQADWYRNLEKDRDATLHIGNWRFTARADFVTDLRELKTVTAAFKTLNPAFDEIARNTMGIDPTTDEGVSKLKLVRLTPTGFPPRDLFTTDLMWTWLIIIPVALIIMRQILKRPRMLLALGGQLMPVIIYVVRQYMSRQQQVVEGVVVE